MTLAALTTQPAHAAPRERDTFADVMQLLGVTPELANQAAARMPVAARRVRAFAPLFVEGSPAEAVYLVRLGTFKSVRVDGEGYEQVLDFAGRGELLGHEALAGLPHACGAVALEDSAAWVMPKADLSALRRAVPAFDDALQRALARQLLHAGEMAELMSAVAAEVRLARFLVHHSARMVARGQSPCRLLLRMSRRDIASYLGLAHETISRALTLLARWGCLRVHNREIDIVDAAALAACARSTRGRWTPVAEPARLAA
jgi:CRP/FNR family transcriptional regulator, anaerobic regulatory protein